MNLIEGETAGARLLKAARVSWSHALGDLVDEQLAIGPRGHCWLPPGTSGGQKGYLVPVDLEGWRIVRRVPEQVVSIGWKVRLAWLRLGISAQLLDDAIVHLTQRSVGGAPLLNQQLMKGAVADAVAEQQLLRALVVSVSVPGADPGPAAVTDLHTRLTAADAHVLRFSGAIGFVRRGLGGLAYLSDLLADCYVGTDYVART